MNIVVKKELYEKEALLKSAYHFVDRAFIHMDMDETNYIVCLKAKKGTLDEQQIADEFENELLAQTVRFHVYQKTHVLRELLMARTLASTIIENEEPVEDPKENGLEDIDSILTDWFIKNEKS